MNSGCSLVGRPPSTSLTSAHTPTMRMATVLLTSRSMHSRRTSHTSCTHVHTYIHEEHHTLHAHTCTHTFTRNITHFMHTRAHIHSQYFFAPYLAHTHTHMHAHTCNRGGGDRVAHTTIIFFITHVLAPSKLLEHTIPVGVLLT
jgi:hypothetical protein